MDESDPIGMDDVDSLKHTEAAAAAAAAAAATVDGYDGTDVFAGRRRQ